MMNLLEKYLYEFSQWEKTDVNDNGLYGYEYLDCYFEENNRYPYLIKVDEKIAAMPSYITRGEDDTHKINANAFERALNTKEGKELYKQIFDNEAFLFKHSNEGMALLEQYRNGEISEEADEIHYG